MNRTLAYLSYGSLALSLSALTAAAQTAGKPIEKNPATTQVRATDAAVASMRDVPARASEIIGTEIVDVSGKQVAEIKDLVVTKTGEVVAIVERGDDLMVAVPLSNLEPRMTKSALPEAKAKERTDRQASGETREVEQFAIKGDRAMFDAAPTVDDTKLIDNAWLTRSCDYFAGRKTAESKDVTDPSKPVAKVEPTCVKTLIGQDVKTTDGDKIGGVKDLAVDLDNGRVAYVVVSVGGVLGMGDTLHAVAFDSLTHNDGWVTTSMTKDSLSRLAKVDLDHLPANPTLNLSMNDDGSSGHQAGRKSN